MPAYPADSEWICIFIKQPQVQGIMQGGVSDWLWDKICVGHHHHRVMTLVANALEELRE